MTTFRYPFPPESYSEPDFINRAYGASVVLANESNEAGRRDSLADLIKTECLKVGGGAIEIRHIGVSSLNATRTVYLIGSTYVAYLNTQNIWADIDALVTARRIRRTNGHPLVVLHGADIHHNLAPPPPPS